MSAKTSIQWTDRSWNPVRGCTIVSAGCTNCYAMKQAHRFSGSGQPYEGLTRLAERGPIWTGKIRLVPEALDEPLRWRKPQKIFVNSMSDLFHESVPDDFIDRVFAVMQLARWHTFQLITKRPERMARYLCLNEPMERMFDTPEWLNAEALQTAVAESPDQWNRAEKAEANRLRDSLEGGDWPPSNVHLGVSIENQETANDRTTILLQTPAAVRFLSVEPLLEQSDLHLRCEGKRWRKRAHPTDPPGDYVPCEHNRYDAHWIDLDWVIVGGESGPHARPCNLDWIRSIVAQCKAAGVACFVKQLGTKAYYPEGELEPWPINVSPKDRKGGEPSEWPKDLRVREFPR